MVRPIVDNVLETLGVHHLLLELGGELAACASGGHEEVINDDLRRGRSR